MKYLLSDSTYTTSYLTYLKDSVDMVVATEKYSIAGSDYGMQHSLEGIDADLLMHVLQDRINSSLKSISKKLEVISCGWNSINTNVLDVTIKLTEEDEYQVSIHL